MSEVRGNICFFYCNTLNHFKHSLYFLVTSHIWCIKQLLLIGISEVIVQAVLENLRSCNTKSLSLGKRKIVENNSTLSRTEGNCDFCKNNKTVSLTVIASCFAESRLLINVVEVKKERRVFLIILQS